MLHQQPFGKFPDDDAGGGADVEGVLGAVLGDFDATIGGINDFLMDSFDFVAEDESVFGVDS